MEPSGNTSQSETPNPTSAQTAINQRSGSTNLKPIALIIVGLLIGILLTLWFGGVFSDDGFPVEVTRAVELGSDAGSGYVRIPESEVPSQYLDVMSMNEVFKAVSSRVTPTVVFIEVESTVTRSFLSPFGREGNLQPSQSLGSGVIISSDGYIVTNNHVVDNASRIRVILNDKREFEARVVGSDPTTDLAVIKVDPKQDIPVIALGDADKVEVGEWVLAVGNPFRLTSTVTAGIVSAIGRQVNVIEDQLGIESFIQTDAAINPGNSGGAVVNLRGELVGIATAIATETGSYEGYGFAVPVDLMERVVRDLIRFGEVKRGYLGVSIVAMNAQAAREVGLDGVRGVYLSNVQRGLAGFEGGLRTGDVLLSINGRSMTEPNELQSAIALFSPGDAVPVEVWRDSRSLTFNVTLKGREDPGYASWLSTMNRPQDQVFVEPQVPEDLITEVEEWGIGVANLDARSRRRFQVAHGVYLADVQQGSPFANAGVERGVIITGINDLPVYNVDTLNDALRQQGNLLVRTVRRDGTTAFYEIVR